MLVLLILLGIFLAIIITLRIFYLLNYRKCKSCISFQNIDEVNGKCLNYKGPLFQKKVKYDYYCDFFKT